MTPEDAEEYTQSLGQILDGAWRQASWAIKQGIPSALGLGVEEWGRRIAPRMPRLAIEERREHAAELADEGLSQREIAAALGVSPMTVNRDLTSVPDDTGEPEQPHVEPMDYQPPVPDDTDEWPARMPLPEAAPLKPPHVGRNAGDNEWYTPAEYIKAATAVMGGIDLDPASSDAANEVVGAAEHYTEDDDGLTQPWSGRVWMNPPYAQPHVDRFCTRVAREFRDGQVTEACVLVNNGTETNWFQEVAAQASAMCFPRGRVKFWHPSKEATPLQGQAVIYLGPNAAGFRAEFLRFGFVVTR